MNLKNYILFALATICIEAFGQNVVAHFDMSLNNGNIVDKVTNDSYLVNSQLPPCTVTGLDGEALRFDGYSNYVKAALPTSALSTESLTLSIMLAAEAYPMMQTDVAETTPTFATICGNLDETAKKGFALQLSSQGDLRLVVGVTYGSGYMIVVDGNEKLPRGKWNQLSMVFDKDGNTVTLYLNGKNIGSKKVNKCALNHSENHFWIGKDATEKKYGPFLINTFCGAIDDIAIYNSITTPSPFTPTIAGLAFPQSRYENDTYHALWRPQYHCMPGGSWTNESHGMIYSNGRYHVFSQKNPNGPYMSRLHWGHYSSDNLYDWHEEPIAIYPSEKFDMKGCWSGCVYEDGGTPYIIYTAVDNAKASIAQVKAKDATLVEWTDKKVIIDGRSPGLSDDFRDPYYFEANGRKFVVVGTSKDGLGACTLHQLKNGTWTNDGSIFFQATNSSIYGTFWEMPNLTPLTTPKEGKPTKWLFTCTPLGLSSGTRTLCWVGTIGKDGKFTPDGGISNVQYLEMGGISKNGYGLLSPTICQKEGKTLLLGIVPDKVSAEQNAQMGWAHTFSLPREINLSADGKLVQKPFSGLTAMRTEIAVEKNFTLIGTEKLYPVSGRQIEIKGEFTVSNGICGFNFLKHDDKQAQLSYDASTGTMKLDYTTLNRLKNDDGLWTVSLPKKVSVGETLKLHVYIDGSIIDIFVGEEWAFSVRLFPTDATAIDAEVFAETSTQVKVSAWTLDAKRKTSGINHPDFNLSSNDIFSIYDLQGRHITKAQIKKGMYIKNGRKYVVR